MVNQGGEMRFNLILALKSKKYLSKPNKLLTNATTYHQIKYKKSFYKNWMKSLNTSPPLNKFTVKFQSINRGDRVTFKFLPHLRSIPLCSCAISHPWIMQAGAHFSHLYDLRSLNIEFNI